MICLGITKAKAIFSIYQKIKKIYGPHGFVTLYLKKKITKTNNIYHMIINSSSYSVKFYFLSFVKHLYNQINYYTFYIISFLNYFYLKLIQLQKKFLRRIDSKDDSSNYFKLLKILYKKIKRYHKINNKVFQQTNFINSLQYIIRFNLEARLHYTFLDSLIRNIFDLKNAHKRVFIKYFEGDPMDRNLIINGYVLKNINAKYFYGTFVKSIVNPKLLVTSFDINKNSNYLNFKKIKGTAFYLDYVSEVEWILFYFKLIKCIRINCDLILSLKEVDDIAHQFFKDSLIIVFDKLEKKDLFVVALLSSAPLISDVNSLDISGTKNPFCDLMEITNINNMEYIFFLGIKNFKVKTVLMNTNEISDIQNFEKNIILMIYLWKLYQRNNEVLSGIGNLELALSILLRESKKTDDLFLVLVKSMLAFSFEGIYKLLLNNCGVNHKMVINIIKSFFYFKTKKCFNFSIDFDKSIINSLKTNNYLEPNNFKRKIIKNILLIILINQKTEFI
ncbi:T-complex protein eta SU (nucleomorph) [Bigelowiella natans]|uniref:T-complex protein eta SU n=1 Tax=Bigelowiella natans TaxID=227086 RepID=Q3LW96_BIGNA|nr:T-complex protein eta SU [Bigelowiella natans]ABA27270.1 T-complex protein eta SU [Bigelowiella natans]|mmetsp:Transcript_17053/g.20526  ORF Transcript_17053/g.20526 Transcript_17053/m.20526 type:complete len:503 (-) Transcript_17053:624-2132(-)